MVYSRYISLRHNNQQIKSTKQMEKVKHLKVLRISVEEMLNRPEREYNPTEWKVAINRMTKYKDCQFYVAEKEPGIYDYTRFFVSYKVDGLFLFIGFSAFSIMLTNNGFCKVHIDEEGNVFKSLFKDSTGKEGYCENDKRNRALIALNCTPNNIMVSNCI